MVATYPNYALWQQQMALAYCKITAQALFRAQLEDFHVSEILSFMPSGDGEHLMLYIEKRDLNTQQVVTWLANRFNVGRGKVGYAGLKDKRAVAYQWFSVQTSMPQSEIDESSFPVRILMARRNNKKLRQSAVVKNNFRIVLREVTGDREQLQQRLLDLEQYGFPNYFTEQRFGSKGDNVQHGLAMLNGDLKVKNRFKQGIYLSAVRSFLFNNVLSRRIQMGNWNSPLDGDVMMLNNSHSLFPVPQVTEEIQQRLMNNEIHITGPLAGIGESMIAGQAQILENEVINGYPELIHGLHNFKQQASRRALRCIAQDLQWQWLSRDTLELRFALAAGCYATALLREVCSLKSN